MVVLAVAGGVFAGGLVKGTTGLGLPMVAVPIMTLGIGVPTAVALMTFPILMSNIWQGVQGGRWKTILRRFWPMLAVQPFGMIAGAAVLARADPRILVGVLGGIIVVFVILVRFQPDWHLSAQAERIAAPLVGLLSGLIGGLSSFFGLPIAMFLFMLRLEKDDFVAAVGVTYSVGATVLILTFTAFGLLGPQLYLWSILAVPVVLGGMWLGQRLRRMLNPEAFRTAVLAILFIAGLNLIRRSITG